MKNQNQEDPNEEKKCPDWKDLLVDSHKKLQELESQRLIRRSTKKMDPAPRPSTRPTLSGKDAIAKQPTTRATVPAGSSAPLGGGEANTAAAQPAPAGGAAAKDKNAKVKDFYQSLK